MMPFQTTWKRLRVICDLYPMEERALRLLCIGANMREVADILALASREVEIYIIDGQRKCRRAQPWYYETKHRFMRHVRQDMIRDAVELLSVLENSNMERPHSHHGVGELAPIRQETVADLVLFWERCLTGGIEEPVRSPVGRLVREVMRRRYVVSR